ncbi:hypothetical protein DL98DRAFT_579411 [Cadophora sp. DSE1049]|nr:hypothetical protein DL98DRAFT_579411 [Cadophora sp. DSE1049]
MSSPPPLIIWDDVRFNNTASQPAPLPPTAATLAGPTIASSSSNSNKKKRRASSDVEVEIESTALNTGASDSKRAKGFASCAEDEIEKKHLEFKSEYNYQPTLQHFAHTCLTLCTTLEHGQVSSIPLDASIMFYSSPYDIFEPQEFSLDYTRGLISVKWLREAVESDEFMAIIQGRSARNDGMGNVMTAAPGVSYDPEVDSGVGVPGGPQEQVGDEDVGMDMDTGDGEAECHASDEYGTGEMWGGEEMDCN